jgi:molybdopterin converting factor small subunit
MNIKIKLIGSINRIAGVKNLILTVQNEIKIYDALSLLSEKVPSLRSYLVNPIPRFLILINGVDIKNLNGLDTQITEDSEITFLSITHGG